MNQVKISFFLRELRQAKGLSPAPLVSMVCAYSGASFISKARERKDKSEFIVGCMLMILMLISTIVFIVK